MSSDSQFGIPGVPFPVGVEYYRAPVPKPELWDEDFARIRAGGMRLIRTFNYWNHLEPRPGIYETDDIDLLFDLAHKHDLRVWLDLPLATHGACPEWLTREHYDMRVVSYRNHVSLTSASPAYPQGSQIHCYDHPAWREYGEKLLRHMIGRYKDHPALLVWGLWDGIALSAAWSKTSDGLPCYGPSTLARYDAWAEGALHTRRAKRARAPPLSPLGRRAAAAFESKRRRDVAVQAVPLREPGRPPPMGHGRCQRRGPGA